MSGSGSERRRVRALSLTVSRPHLSPLTPRPLYLYHFHHVHHFHHSSSGAPKEKPRDAYASRGFVLHR